MITGNEHSIDGSSKFRHQASETVQTTVGMGKKKGGGKKKGAAEDDGELNPDGLAAK